MRASVCMMAANVTYCYKMWAESGLWYSVSFIVIRQDLVSGVHFKPT